MKPILKITTFSLLATFALTAKALPPAKFYTSVGIGYDSPSASIASYDPVDDYIRASHETGENIDELGEVLRSMWKNTTSMDKSHLAYELSSGVKFAMPNQRFSWGGELGLVGLPKVQASVNITTSLSGALKPDPADWSNVGYTQSMTNRFGLNLLATGFYHFKQRFNADVKLGVSYMTNKYEFTSNPSAKVAEVYRKQDVKTSSLYEAYSRAQTKTIKKVIPVVEAGLSYQLPKHIQVGFNISHYFGKSVEFKNVKGPLALSLEESSKIGLEGGEEPKKEEVQELMRQAYKKAAQDRLPNDVLADTVVMASVSYDF